MRQHVSLDSICHANFTFKSFHPSKIDPQKKSFNLIFDIYSKFMPKLQTDLGLKVKNIEKQKNKININKAKRIKKFSFTFKNKEDRLNINRNENNTERII